MKTNRGCCSVPRPFSLISAMFILWLLICTFPSEWSALIDWVELFAATCWRGRWHDTSVGFNTHNRSRRPRAGDLKWTKTIRKDHFQKMSQFNKIIQKIKSRQWNVSCWNYFKMCPSNVLYRLHPWSHILFQSGRWQLMAQIPDLFL